MKMQQNLTDLFEDEKLVPDNDELWEEYNSIFIENWTNFRRQIANFIPWDRTQDIVQYSYVRLLHRGPEQARNLKSWIQSGIKTTAIKFYQRFSSSQHSLEKLDSCDSNTKREERDNTFIDMNAYNSSTPGDKPCITPNEYLNPLPEQMPDERMIREERDEKREKIFMMAFEHLDEGEQRILREYKLKDKPGDEVAEMLGYRPSTVRTKCSRAIKKMKAWVDTNDLG